MVSQIKLDLARQLAGATARGFTLGPAGWAYVKSLKKTIADTPSRRNALCDNMISSQTYSSGVVIVEDLDVWHSDSMLSLLDCIAGTIPNVVTPFDQLCITYDTEHMSTARSLVALSLLAGWTVWLVNTDRSEGFCVNHDDQITISANSRSKLHCLEQAFALYE